MRPRNRHANIVRENRPWRAISPGRRVRGGTDPPGSRIIPCFAKDFAMEAEQLNALANTLADLSTRTRELRRYL